MAASAPLKITRAPPLPAPTGRRPIGFRGNHQHKKALYDPVYRTTKTQASFALARGRLLQQPVWFNLQQKPVAVLVPLAVQRWASEGVVFCHSSGSFVPTRKKLHAAFEAFDALENDRKWEAQRSRAVSWGRENNSDVDSDDEDQADEEAESLKRFLAGARKQARA
ncbi:hypothetical protein ACSSS7_005360 [Eimeria intestinalis]